MCFLSKSSGDFYDFSQTIDLHIDFFRQRIYIVIVSAFKIFQKVVVSRVEGGCQLRCKFKLKT